MSTDPNNPGPPQGWTPSSAGGSNPLPPPAPGPGAGPGNPTIGPGAPQGIPAQAPVGAGGPTSFAPGGTNTPSVAPSYPTAVAPPPPPEGPNKGLIAAIGIGVLVIALGIGGYFFFLRPSNDPIKVEASATNSPGTTATQRSAGSTPGTSSDSDSSTDGTANDGEGAFDDIAGTTLSIPTPDIDVPEPTTTTTTARSGGNSGGGSSGGGGNSGGGSSGGGGGGGGNTGGGGGGGNTGGGGGGVTPTNPPPTNPPPTQPPKPTINSFATTNEIFCTTTDTVKDGTVTWSVSNAVEVAVTTQNVPDAFMNPFISGLGNSGTATVNVHCQDPNQQTAVLTARDAAGNKVTQKATFRIRQLQT